MERSLLVALFVVTACLSMAVPALAEGTWPASVKLATSVAPPGATVSFSGQGPAGVGSGPCFIEFDKVVLPTADCSWDQTGAITGAFAVPSDTAIGTVATVSVCWPGCYDDSVDDVFPNYWQANVSLEIVPPFLDVPDVRCLPEPDATAQLTEAGWQVIIDRRLGDVVTDMEPRPPAQLQQTVPIVLFLYGVPVPDVVGSSYDDARRTLSESCLAISAVDGITDGTVERQDPGVDTLIPGGATATVTMSGSTREPTTTPPTTTPPVTTPVTPISGEPEPDSDLDPVLFVAAGSALALVLALMLASGLLARTTQRHREVAWVTAHVTVRPRPGSAQASEVAPSDDHDRDHVITVVPQEARRSTTVEEDPS
jgi:PASTA domain